MDRLQTRVGQDELITLREASVLSGPRAICLRHPMRIPCIGCRETARPVPLNSDSINSTRLETRVTESIACGTAFAHNCAGSAAARLNQSDIVFIFSMRLEPTKTLQGSG